MGQISYRANLSAKSFPFLASNWGRSVMVAQYDNTFNREVTSNEDSDRDVGIPQLYYCHNVMPDAEGFQSIGYKTGFSASGATFTEDIVYLRDTLTSSSTNATWVGISGSNVYTCQGLGFVWSLFGVIGGGLTAKPGTCFLQGIHYLFVPNSAYGAIKLDISGVAIVQVTLTGLNIPDILGITSANGYCIAWSKNTIFWSSSLDIDPALNAIDFVPSLTTGAGSSKILQARGAITGCVPHALGFLIYTASNVVAAVYTGNSRYPFAFKEIVSSGGVLDLNSVSYDGNTGNQYAYTSSGLQLVTTTQTQVVFPEVTDFISGGRFEDYDYATDTFTTSDVPATDPMYKRVTTVADRYLVISYGLVTGATPVYTHALVYDLSLKRWGKLKYSHNQVVEIDGAGAKKSFALAQRDGSTKQVDFTYTATAGDSVAILGKYQFVRARLLQLDEIEVESLYQPSAFELKVLTALDGKNTSLSTATLNSSSGNLKTFGARAIGINHSLVCKGSFQLSTVLLKFNIHGKR